MRKILLSTVLGLTITGCGAIDWDYINYGDGVEEQDKIIAQANRRRPILNGTPNIAGTVMPPASVPVANNAPAPAPISPVAAQPNMVFANNTAQPTIQLPNLEAPAPQAMPMFNTNRRKPMGNLGQAAYIPSDSELIEPVQLVQAPAPVKNIKMANLPVTSTPKPAPAGYPNLQIGEQTKITTADKKITVKRIDFAKLSNFPKTPVVDITKKQQQIADLKVEMGKMRNLQTPKVETIKSSKPFNTLPPKPMANDVGINMASIKTPASAPIPTAPVLRTPEQIIAQVPPVTPQPKVIVTEPTIAKPTAVAPVIAKPLPAAPIAAPIVVKNLTPAVAATQYVPTTVKYNAPKPTMAERVRTKLADLKPLPGSKKYRQLRTRY